MKSGRVHFRCIAPVAASRLSLVFGSGIMVRDELRIVVAAVATFAALFGVAVSIHGLLYYENNVVLSGMIAAGVGILACVWMLTLHPKDIERHQHRES